MAGNVWEWTASVEGEYRVLRGSAWIDDSRWARCAYRFRNYPDLWPGYRGVRVVLSLAISDF